MKVVCVGHSTYDTTLPMDFYPTENIKYRIPKHIECGGGPASNGAYLLAKWGMNTTMLSVVGKDYYGDQIIKEFQSIGASTEYIEQKEGHGTSSSYIIANRSNGSRTIITAKSPAVRKLSHNIDLQADVILIDGEHPETAEEVLLENPSALSVIDAGRLNDDTRKSGKLVTYLVCSKEFAEEFSNSELNANDINTLINAYEQLKEYFNTNIVITLEAAGSFTVIDGEYKVIPTVKVTSIDSTGAGDIFHGAFTYFISNGYSLEDTIKYSSITSAISVTRVGSRNSIPELREVLEYDEVI